MSLSKYINDKTGGFNTLISLEDKIRYLITDYENPLVNIEKLTELLSRIIIEIERSSTTKDKS